ncbi:MAG: OprD family outer membrane porin [Woeseiaceae bacterium]|nr:OprD family outer membrane porin [Woeseiaceae bacterium]
MAHATGSRLGLCVVVFAFCAEVGNAGEYGRAENVAPESAEDVQLGLDELDEELELPAYTLAEDGFGREYPFWADSQLSLNVRAFDFDRVTGLGPLEQVFEVGTELAFESGKFDERWSVGASWHTSSVLNDRIDEKQPGAPEPADISVLSRTWLRYDFPNNWLLSLYRQDFNLPYLNRLDIRMIPNTHEGYVVKHLGDDFEFIAGHIAKFKRRDSDRFVPMGEAAGVAGDKSGTEILGARGNVTPLVNVGGIVLHTQDLFTTAYAELSFKQSFDEAWAIQLAAQGTRQFSNGDERIGNFDTNFWGARIALSYKGTVLKLARTGTGRGGDIQRPFGGSPAFTSSMIFDFDRAGEQARRIGLSQNFADFDLPAVSFVATYTDGRGAIAPDGTAFPDSKEIAFTADYQPQRGPLKGLWLRVRWADADRGSPAADRKDLRIIINYSLNML